MPLEDRRAEGDRGQRHLGADGMVREADDRVRERPAQVSHALQRHELGRRGVEVGALQQRIVDPGLVEDGDGTPDALDGLHPRRHYDRLSLRRDVPDQRQAMLHYY